MKYPGILEGTTPEEMRRHAMANILGPMARAAFEARSEINSAILAVAQYWNDEADEAVHSRVHYSKRKTPIWPHECGFGEERSPDDSPDFCRWCRGEEERIPGHPDLQDWTPWDDNGTAIPAFEAFCREECHQEMSTSEAYIPYAVARREGGIEIVGRPVRPWLDRPAPLAQEPLKPQHQELLGAVYAAPRDDGARMVLADWLLEHGHPHGEIIALQMSAKDAVRLGELLAEHGRRIMGAIEPCVTRSGATFRRGFLSEAEIYADDEDVLESATKDAACGTVEAIHFLTGSLQTLSPAMTALQRVSGLEDEAFVAASRSVHPVRDLALVLEEKKTLEVLCESNAFPELRRLELGGEIQPDRVEELLAGSIASQLETFAVDAEATEIGAYLRAMSRSNVSLEIVERGDLGRLMGFRLLFQKDAGGKRSILRVSLDNVLGIGNMHYLGSVLEAVPSDLLERIELVRSAYLDPVLEDVAVLKEATRNHARLRSIEITSGAG